MNGYYWMFVDSVEELDQRYSGMGILRDRAIELLNRGVKDLQVGQMWHSGQWHYKLRYSEPT